MGDLASIQRALKVRGFDPGPIDGKMGPKTRDAVRAFQRSAGLSVDGIVGPQTLGALSALRALTLATPVRAAAPAGRTIRKLIIHCTATHEGQEKTRDEIDDMHKARGFTMIGYHRLYHLDGRVSQGRPEGMVGAHVSGHNADSLGWAYVGGLDAAGRPKDTRTAAQKSALERDIAETLRRIRSISIVAGHRDFSPDLDGDGIVEPFEWVKVCPCFNAAAEYGPLLEAARRAW